MELVLYLICFSIIYKPATIVFQINKYCWIPTSIYSAYCWLLYKCNNFLKSVVNYSQILLNMCDLLLNDFFQEIVSPIVSTHDLVITTISNMCNPPASPINLGTS